MFSVVSAFRIFPGVWNVRYLSPSSTLSGFHTKAPYPGLLFQAWQRQPGARWGQAKRLGWTGVSKGWPWKNYVKMQIGIIAFSGFRNPERQLAMIFEHLGSGATKPSVKSGGA